MATENKYEKVKKMFDDFAKLAKDHGVVIITTTQPTRVLEGQVIGRTERAKNEVIIIDHLPFING